ncbi:MAG: hypothetical protein AAFV53_11780 [Myxococcota bacterium]
MTRGKLVVVEGIDGAGKSDLVHGLAERLPQLGIEVERVGRILMPELMFLWNRLVSADAITQRMAATLAAADLIAGGNRRIEPALAAGRWVLVNSYVYTHRIRFGMRGVPKEELDALFSEFIQPDIIFHLRIPLAHALARIQPRGHLDMWSTGLDAQSPSIGTAWRQRRTVPLVEREAAFLSWQAQAQARFPAMLPPELTVNLPGEESTDSLVEAALAALELPSHG